MNRPLSDLEHAIWLIDQAVPQNFVMVARISHLSGLLANFETILRQALDMVQQRHPPLKSKIKEGKVPKFVYEDVPPIPMQIIQRKDDLHWLDVAEKEMQEPFPWTKGPFARTILLKSPDKFDLLMTFLHMAVDAASGVNFVQNLLRAADKISRGDTSSESPLPALPFSGELLRKDVIKKAKLLSTSDSTDLGAHSPVELKGDQEVPPEKRINRVIPGTFSPKETKKLLTRCRKEKTSVHEALCASILQTLVEQVKESREVPKKDPLLIGCCTPVNIRHLFSKTVDENMGNFISDALHFQLIDNNASLWTAAREVKDSLNKILDSREDIKVILNVGELLKVYSTPGDLLSGVSQSFPPVVVSNMGRLDIPEQFGELSLEELHFVVSINPAAKNGFGIAVTSFRGGINLNFLYAEPYISKKRAALMVESIMKRLREAIRR